MKIPWNGPGNKRYYKNNPSDLALDIANADGILGRKDTVVLRWDINERDITIMVLTGSFSSSPVAPAIVRGAEQYDLKIAEIDIPAGTTAITQAQIKDTRLDASVCGIVHAVIEQLDTTTFYNQISADLTRFKAENEAAFEEWFQNVQDALSGDVAGNLLNMINGLQSSKADKSIFTTAVLEAANWTGVIAPYSQTLPVSNVTSTSVNEILPGEAINADQISALQAANLMDGGQAVGSVTLLAYGDKPLINIPIRVIIRGDA